jgi:hypothetical protein
MKEAGNGGGLLAIAQPAHSAAKVLDEPPNPAFIVLPLFQGSVFLGVIVKYLFVIMRRLIFIEQGGQLSGANSSLFLPWGVRWHYKAARATGHRSSINAASPWDRADAIPSLLRLAIDLPSGGGVTLGRLFTVRVRRIRFRKQQGNDSTSISTTDQKSAAPTDAPKLPQMLI